MKIPASSSYYLLLFLVHGVWEGEEENITDAEGEESDLFFYLLYIFVYIFYIFQI